jgi:hypothetical protein
MIRGAATERSTKTIGREKAYWGPGNKRPEKWFSDNGPVSHFLEFCLGSRS